MTTEYLQLVALDPLVARDGRPFGIDQGNRMKGLGWLYPSVVAGSFRTALVKASGGDFAGDTPQKLLGIAVAGVFPVAGDELCLPAPHDCVVEEMWQEREGKKEKTHVAHRAAPPSVEIDNGEGCDWPDNLSLRPVLIAREGDFKPATGPAWWPVGKLTEWLTTGKFAGFDATFLSAAGSQVRDHVQLDFATGAAAESRLFATAGLNLMYLAKFGAKMDSSFAERFAAITLTARIQSEMPTPLLHPLGGERRLVHWKPTGSADLWKCPETVRAALEKTNSVRMILATPAIFDHGWRPSWIDQNSLEGTPPESTVRLKLIGVCISRWKAVSGWSLAEPRGPKPVRRLVPAGGVYFFKTNDNAVSLADRWLQPISDAEQDRKDGFGLAVWGTW
jgi:CRISPR-associated protein Cmr3